MSEPSRPREGSRDAAVLRSVAAIAVSIAVATLAVALIVTAPDHRSGAAAPATARLSSGVGRPASFPVPRSTEAGVRYERYQRPDPELPRVPAGKVKHFRVDVLMHRTKVSDDEPPLRVWSFGVDGRFTRGTGASPPMVVNEGDTVDVEFVNGANAGMHVNMPHSLDMHAAEVAPNDAFKTIDAGSTWHYRFVARHPGVYMYHCATEPMVLHLGAGMVGMFVVRPKHLPRADRELWMVQQEYYLPRHAGDDPDFEKMRAGKPDVFAFNGYAHQYMTRPIHVRRGEKVRMWVLNAGPSHVSSFHVIGAVFDRTVSEGIRGGPAQALSLAPSTGGYVDFKLRQEGAYPFVDHDFAAMDRGAMGAMVTDHAPAGAVAGL